MTGSQTAVLARRNLLHVSSDPQQMIGLPGLLVQGIAFGTTQTAVGLNADFQRGLIDRFRSLPMARSAVVAGRVTADLVRTGTVQLNLE